MRSINLCQGRGLSLHQKISNHLNPAALRISDPWRHQSRISWHDVTRMGRHSFRNSLILSKLKLSALFSLHQKCCLLCLKLAQICIFSNSSIWKNIYLVSHHAMVTCHECCSLCHECHARSRSPGGQDPRVLYTERQHSPHQPPATSQGRTRSQSHK